MNEDTSTRDHLVLAGIKWVSAGLLFMMMVVTFVDVIGRYLLHSPIFGAAEMIQFLLAGTVFSGLILVSNQNSHIVVELLSPAIHARMPVFHNLVVGLFSISGLLVIGVELSRISLHALAIGRLTIVLEWPVAFVTIPAAFFCFVAAVAQMRWLIRR